MKKLDHISDLIDDVESTGEFRAKEITKCTDCGEWKIPRYDQKTRKMTFRHICSKQEEPRAGRDLEGK